jgi:hypothetical protein
MAPAKSDRGNTNMNATLNTEMNDVRALSACELDAVSGGAIVKLFDFKVAGMHVVGSANLDTGHYAVWVKSGGTLIIKGGKA